MKKGTIDTRLLEYHISKRIQDDVRSQRVCGAAVAVLQRGQLIYRGYFGLQHPQKEEPLRADAIFRIASMTKPITTVAVLQLAQQGKLDLQDEVAKYLPQYARLPMASGGYNRVSMRIWHLLTHTSAMEADAGYRETARYQIPPETNRTIADAVDYYAGLALPYEPGEHRRYSGRVAFDVLGRIVEVVSGVEFAEYVRQNILQPCGMADTTFAPTPEQWQRVVGMHNYVDGKGVAAPTVPGCVMDNCPVTHPLGGSGLVSTLDDYIKFAQMLLHKGMAPGGRVLDEAWIDEMRKAQLPKEMMSESVNQGLGVRVITGDGYPWLPDGTYGWSGAYGTHFWVDPVNEIVAVYLKNSHYDGGSGALTGKHFEEDVFLSIL